MFLCGFATMMVAMALPPDDYHKMPSDLGGVRELQDVLQSRLEKARAATVCVQMGANSGTGVVVSPDGLVLSAAHVVTGVSRRVDLLFEDGTVLEAHSLGLNADNDAAMLQIVDPPEGLAYVDLWKADADEWAPKTVMGTWVFALGHSGGFDETRGAVLRLGRVLRMAKDTIETDCSLIGGDSGGPLFNLDGQLIAIHSRVGRRVVKNMHVPVTAFTRDWSTLKSGEFMGDGPFAEVETIEEKVLGASLYESKTEVVVTAGFAIDGDGRPRLEAGDTIMSIGGAEVSKLEQIREFLNARSESFELGVMRGEEEMTFKVDETESE